MASFNEMVQGLAGMFEERTRVSNGETFVALVDGAPESLRDVIRDDLHDGGSVLPSDWVYAAAPDAARTLADYVEDETTPEDVQDQVGEIAAGLVDVGTTDRLRWLAECPSAVEAVDEIAGEHGWPKSGGVVDLIGMAQALAYENIVNHLIWWAEHEAEEPATA